MILETRITHHYYVNQKKKPHLKRTKISFIKAIYLSAAFKHSTSQSYLISSRIDRSFELANFIEIERIKIVLSRQIVLLYLLFYYELTHLSPIYAGIIYTFGIRHLDLLWVVNYRLSR